MDSALHSFRDSFLPHQFAMTSQRLQVDRLRGEHRAERRRPVLPRDLLPVLPSGQLQHALVRQLVGRGPRRRFHVRGDLSGRG